MLPFPSMKGAFELLPEMKETSKAVLFGNLCLIRKGRRNGRQITAVVIMTHQTSKSWEALQAVSSHLKN